jgi:hypothetical protein
MADQPTTLPKRYQVPTHLQVADKIAIGPVSVTIRQGVILLLGAALAYQGWHALALLGDLGVGWLRVVVVALFVILAVVLAQVRLAGRYLESWALVWSRYHWQPRVFLWRRVSVPLTSTLLVQEAT